MRLWEVLAVPEHLPRRRIGAAVSIRKRKRELEALGLLVEHTGGGHLKLTRSDGVGQAVYIASTPGQGRAQRNARASIRRLLRNG